MFSISLKNVAGSRCVTHTKSTFHDDVGLAPRQIEVENLVSLLICNMQIVFSEQNKCFDWSHEVRGNMFIKPICRNAALLKFPFTKFCVT